MKLEIAILNRLDMFTISRCCCVAFIDADAINQQDRDNKSKSKK